MWSGRGRRQAGWSGAATCRNEEWSTPIARVRPVAITNGRFSNRPDGIHRSFYLQVCKANAKASPPITHTWTC